MWNNGLKCLALLVFLIGSTTLALASLEAPKLEMVWSEQSISTSKDSEPTSNLDYLRTLAAIIFAKDIKVKWANPRDLSQGALVEVRKIIPMMTSNGLSFQESWQSHFVPLENLIPVSSSSEPKYLVPFTNHLSLSYRTSNLCGAEVEALATIEIFLQIPATETLPIATYGIDVEELASYGKAGMLDELPVLSACYE